MLPGTIIYLPLCKCIRVIVCCRMPFPIGRSVHSSALCPLMPPMITSPIQLNTNLASEVPALVPTCHGAHSEQLTTDAHSQQIQPLSSAIHTGLPRSDKDDVSDSAANSKFDPEKFRDLQSETQQLSDQLTDFELVWTPRSAGDADELGLLKFPDDYTENESEWA